MRASSFVLALASLAAAAPCAIAQRAAETAPAATAFQIAPYTGYMLFGNLVDGPIGTSLSTSASPVFGVQLGMTIVPGVSVIGNFARASGDLQVGVPFLGGMKVGTSTALLFDGGLQLAIPTPRTGGLAVQPFVQAGIGGMRYNIDVASVVKTHATNLTYNVGGGLDVPIGSSVALRLMAKDYIGKFDFKEATTLNVSGKTAQNWALSAGVRLDF